MDDYNYYVAQQKNNIHAFTYFRALGVSFTLGDTLSRSLFVWNGYINGFGHFHLQVILVIINCLAHEFFLEFLHIFAHM